MTRLCYPPEWIISLEATWLAAAGCRHGEAQSLPHFQRAEVAAFPASVFLRMLLSDAWTGMFQRLFLRIFRLSRRPTFRVLLLIFFTWNFLETFSVRRSVSLSQHDLNPDHGPQNQKIFIATTHWNNEAVLRSHWNNAIESLVTTLGPDNVYISIYESGSWDDTKDALRLLDRNLGALGVGRTIILNETTHVDEISRPPAPSGWIDTPRGKKELRRIPYLSALRNLSLKPLEELAEKGLRFDKILFLNDVVFMPQDVLNLLNTNDGDYAAACALDFAKPPKYYDTFALRDSRGDEPMMQVWPYFRSWQSRAALKASKPVPVQSCWNGMVFMEAAPFYGNNPLRFRGVPDSLANHHLEASECCLIHADNPLSLTQGVWLNPNVRVGYNGLAYEIVNPARSSWLSSSDILVGLWKARIWRWVTTTYFKDSVVDRRLRAWEQESDVRYWENERNARHHEPGRHCLIDEMQVLVSNGWAHV